MREFLDFTGVYKTLSKSDKKTKVIVRVNFFVSVSGKLGIRLIATSSSSSLSSPIPP